MAESQRTIPIQQQHLLGETSTGEYRADPGHGTQVQTPEEKARTKSLSVGARVPIIPGYEILVELGRGGMGVVYKARQNNLNRVLALKMVISGEYVASAQLARFQIEAEAVAKLKHPNIVQLYDFGTHDGLPYFTLEYMEGGSLASKIKDNSLSPREAAKIVEQLGRGMATAHAQGIIHRDLKPENVLLSIDGVPKIADFGLAKQLEDVADSEQHRGQSPNTTAQQNI